MIPLQGFFDATCITVWIYNFLSTPRYYLGGDCQKKMDISCGNIFYRWVVTVCPNPFEEKRIIKTITGIQASLLHSLALRNSVFVFMVIKF